MAQGEAFFVGNFLYLMAGCSQVPDEIPPTTMEVNNFADLGEMHNSFLDNAVANLDRIDLDDPDLRVKQLRDLNAEHLREFGFSESERRQIEGKLLDFSPLFDEREVADRGFYRKENWLVQFKHILTFT